VIQSIIEAARARLREEWVAEGQVPQSREASIATRLAFSCLPPSGATVKHIYLEMNAVPPEPKIEAMIEEMRWPPQHPSARMAAAIMVPVVEHLLRQIQKLREEDQRVAVRVTESSIDVSDPLPEPLACESLIDQHV
jgi:hypothetical protein